MKRTQIYLSKDLHNKLENFAFIFSKKEKKKITMSEIIRRALKTYFEENENIPNEITLKAMSELENIKDLKQYNIDEFFKETGLDKL